MSKKVKIILIVVLILAIVITAVVIIRKRKRKSMIEKIKASGTSITDDVLNSMSYADLKKLAEATGVVGDNTSSTNPSGTTSGRK